MKFQGTLKAGPLDGVRRRETRRGRPLGATRIACVAPLVAVILIPCTVRAQGGPGFLFDQPRVSVGARLGYAIPAVDSDLFDFARQQLTLEAGDFRSPTFGGEIAIRVANRVDFVADLAWARSRRSSEYRDWEDLDGLPIEQETTFERTSMTAGVRYYLRDRGRRVGQFAWVPNRIAPFVGGGVGARWHAFRQAGDFVDFDTLEVFRDRLETSGVSAIVDLRVGADFSLSRRVFLAGEVRYDFGSGRPGGDYVGFTRTDLSGVGFVFGISFRL